VLCRSFPFDCLLGSIGLDRLPRLVLRGELLLHFGGDGLGVHLVGLRGAAENFAAIRLRPCRKQNDNLDQGAAKLAFICLTEN
jgi:hypothetical protein